MADGSVEIQITADDSDAKEKLSSLSSLAETIAGGASGIGSALSAVSGYISEIGASFEGATGQIISSAASAASGIVSAFSSAASTAVSAATQMISGIASGISGGIGTVTAVVSNMGARIVSTISGYVSSFVSIGANIAAGVASGIQSRIASVVSAAVSLVQSAVSAAKSAAGIHSPSRVMRDEVGKMMGEGLAIGITAGEKDVSEAMGKLSQAAIKDAKEKAKNYKEVGSLYAENMTYGLKEGKEAAISAFEDLVDDAFSAFETAGNYLTGDYKKAADLLTDTYKQALENGYDDALAIVKDRMTEIASAYQKEYESIIKNQEKMQKNLASSTDLFSFSKEGRLSIENLDASVKQIERYDKLLSALTERGVSDDFMAEITSLDLDEGIKAAEKVLSLSDKAFENLQTKWAEKQQLAKRVAEKFYADQLTTLDENFNKELSDNLSELPDQLEEIGKNTMAGFISGMESQMSKIAASARAAADKVVSTMRSALDIHSPSKKMAKLVGIPTAEGIETGFLAEMKHVYQSMKQAVDTDLGRLSIGTAIDATRAAFSAEKPQTERIYQSSVTEKVSKIGIDDSGLSSFARELLKVLKIEENRVGTKLIGGQGG